MKQQFDLNLVQLLCERALHIARVVYRLPDYWTVTLHLGTLPQGAIAMINMNHDYFLATISLDPMKINGDYNMVWKAIWHEVSHLKNSSISEFEERVWSKLQRLNNDKRNGEWGDYLKELLRDIRGVTEKIVSIDERLADDRFPFTPKLIAPNEEFYLWLAETGQEDFIPDEWLMKIMTGELSRKEDTVKAEPAATKPTPKVEPKPRKKKTKDEVVVHSGNVPKDLLPKEKDETKQQ